MLLGDCLARYMLHDCMAALDYLSKRPDIDADRIGMTGNSGGGTLTMMMMMADSRLKAAAPATFVTSREAFLTTGQCQDSEQIWRGLSSQGIDHEDGILCMAPKPVLVLAARHDFFPFFGTVKTFERCRKYWEIYHADDRFELFCDDSGHEYSTAMVEKAVSFFTEYLMNEVRNERISGVAEAEPLAEKRLWCTYSGCIRKDFPDVKGIFEENREKFSCLEAKKNAWPEEERRHSAEIFLREAIFRNRSPVPLYTRKIRKRKVVLDLVCDSIIWNTQDKMINHGYLFSDPGKNMGKMPVTIGLWADGCKSLQQHYTFTVS